MKDSDFREPRLLNYHARSLARQVYGRLGADNPDSFITRAGKKLAPIAEIGVWLDNNLSTDEDIAGADFQILKLRFRGTQFGENDVGPDRLLDIPWLFDIGTADHGIAPVINVKGVLMGTDKWEHFFQQGYWLFDMGMTNPDKYGSKDPSHWRKAFSEWLEGFPAAPDLKEFRTYVSPYNKDVRKGYYGTYATGRASNGDVAANEQGFQFYMRLYESFQKDPKGAPFTFSLKDYDVRGFNEENNPGYTVPGLKTNPGYLAEAKDWDNLRAWMMVRKIKQYPLFDPSIRP
jgi:hypothetical protein